MTRALDTIDDEENERTVDWVNGLTPFQAKANTEALVQ